MLSSLEYIGNFVFVYIFLLQWKTGLDRRKSIQCSMFCVMVWLERRCYSASITSRRYTCHKFSKILSIFCFKQTVTAVSSFSIFSSARSARICIMSVTFIQCFQYSYQLYENWVNPSKSGGMDAVFRGLAGLLWGISRGQSRIDIPRSSPASPTKTLSIQTLLLGFTFYLK